MDGKEQPPEMTPAEAARARRRDRDAEAKARRGMRTGLAKQFKQVLDTQARRAAEAEPKAAQKEPKAAQAEPKTRRARAGRTRD
jgi:hypothetical protein